MKGAAAIVMVMVALQAPAVADETRKDPCGLLWWSGEEIGAHVDHVDLMAGWEGGIGWQIPVGKQCLGAAGGVRVAILDNLRVAPVVRVALGHWAMAYLQAGPLYGAGSWGFDAQVGLDGRFAAVFMDAWRLDGDVGVVVGVRLSIEAIVITMALFQKSARDIGRAGAQFAAPRH